jgi:hypothetical protein
LAEKGVGLDPDPGHRKSRERNIVKNGLFKAIERKRKSVKIIVPKRSPIQVLTRQSVA